MGKEERASRAEIGNFGDLGFLGLLGFLGFPDSILWIAWVVRWQDLWPGFDLPNGYPIFWFRLLFDGRKSSIGGNQASISALGLLGFEMVFSTLWAEDKFFQLIARFEMQSNDRVHFGVDCFFALRLFDPNPYNFEDDCAVLLGSSMDWMCSLLDFFCSGEQSLDSFTNQIM